MEKKNNKFKQDKQNKKTEKERKVHPKMQM